jgi:Flp pilus assembly protein TadD
MFEEDDGGPETAPCDDAMSRDARAASEDAEDLHAQLGLGRAHLRHRDWREALNVFQRAASMAPDVPACHLGLGRAYKGLGRLSDATTAFRTTLGLFPRHLAAARELVCTLSAHGRPQEIADAWLALGAALEARGRLDEAMFAYRQAIRHCPHHPNARFAFGTVAMHLRRWDDAATALATAVDLAPEHRAARFNLGWTFHFLGNRPRAWRELRWHDDNSPYYRRSFAQPEWDGEVLDDKSLLIWSDQGLGDAISYLRYVEQAHACAKHILMECDRALLPLVQRLACVDDVVPRGAILPRFHAQVRLTRLPEIIERRLTRIPGRTPYLTADPGLVSRWRRTLGQRGGRTVGIVWSGNVASWNAARRFTSLRSFGALEGIDGVRFVSLQQGPPAVESLDPPAGLRLHVCREPLSSLHETAALIANLDLVITVDTAVAHLAGALGRPVWTLLIRTPDWRWGLDELASTWYPTMKLFRQPRAGDWRGLFEEVRTAVVAWRHEHTDRRA